MNLVKRGTFRYERQFHGIDVAGIADPETPYAELRKPDGTWVSLPAPTKQNGKTGLYGGSLDMSDAETYPVGCYALRVGGTVATAREVATVVEFYLSEYTWDEIMTGVTGVHDDLALVQGDVTLVYSGVKAIRSAVRARNAYGLTVVGDSTSFGVTSTTWPHKLMSQIDTAASLAVGRFTPWYGVNETPGSLFPNQAAVDGWASGSITKTLGGNAGLFGQWSPKEVTLVPLAGASRFFYRVTVIPESGTQYCFSVYVRLPSGAAPTENECQLLVDGTARSTTFTNVPGTTWYRATAAAHTTGTPSYSSSYGIALHNGATVIIACPQFEYGSASTAFMPTKDFDWDRKLTGDVWTLYNASRAGMTTSEAKDHFASNALGHSSDYVLIDLGLNDVYLNYAPASVLSRLLGMASDAASSGANVVLATLTPYGLGTTEQKDAIRTINAGLRAACVSNGYILADNYAAFDPNDTGVAAALQLADQLHPNEAGHAVKAATVLSALLPDVVVPLLSDLANLDVPVSSRSTGNVNGSGADQVTLHLGAIAAGAEVWITTDLAGVNVIAGTLVADDDGDVVFMLDGGDTYYLWRKKPGVEWTNPVEFVAVAD